MSSRKRSQNKPLWKRRATNSPAYVRETGYNEDGTVAIDPITNEPIYRDRPNRAMKRAHYAMIRKDIR